MRCRRDSRAERWPRPGLLCRRGSEGWGRAGGVVVAGGEGSEQDVYRAAGQIPEKVSGNATLRRDFNGPCTEGGFKNMCTCY